MYTCSTDLHERHTSLRLILYLSNVSSMHTIWGSLTGKTLLREVNTFGFLLRLTLLPSVSIGKHGCLRSRSGMRCETPSSLSFFTTLGFILTKKNATKYKANT